MTTLDDFADDLLALGTAPLLVVTGAGISVASGIPTFRGTDDDAIWSRDPMELGTRRYFERDPVGSWRWYTERFARVFEARPNAAHRALVDLERWHVGRGGSFLLVTQNIDTLHEQAGSSEFVKVHGTADRLRCPRAGCTNAAPLGSIPLAEVDLDRFQASPSADRLPRCPACGSVLRPHVLWFDECYDEHVDYQIKRVDEAISRMALACFIGTSLSVGITDMIVRRGQYHGIPLYHVDPAATSAYGLRPVTGAAEGMLPELVAKISH